MLRYAFLFGFSFGCSSLLSVSGLFKANEIKTDKNLGPLYPAGACAHDFALRVLLVRVTV